MSQAPNILFILSDQHRALSTGAYGRTDARTPCIDKLAGQSILFEQAYCQYPICVASRQSLLTGQYPGNNGTYQNYLQSIDPWQWTFPGAFTKAGYDTVLIGKAHCNTNGFLYRRIYEEWAHESWDKAVYESIKPPFFGLDYRLNAQTVGPWPYPEAYLHGQFVNDQALDFFRHRSGERPFLAFLSYEQPHPPFLVPQSYLDLFPPESLSLPPEDSCIGVNPHWGEELLSEPLLRRYLQGYYANLAYVDARIGEMLSFMESCGWLDSTIVIYTSDHGEAGGAHKKYEKHSFFEPEVHVPLLIRLPGAEAGRVDSIVELIDLAPTLLDYSGIGEKPAHSLDGSSLRPLIEAEGGSWKNRAICENYWPARTLRDGQKAAEDYGRMIRRGDWKCFIGGNMPYPHGLFNLREDPDELCNLWDCPDHQQLRDSLLKEINEGWKKIPSPAENHLPAV